MQSSVPGALHHRIVSVDVAKKPKDAKHIAVIDRVIDGLLIAARSKNVGASQSGEMLGKGELAERSDYPFEFGYRSFYPVGKLVQNSHAFGIAHRT